MEGKSVMSYLKTKQTGRNTLMGKVWDETLVNRCVYDNAQFYKPLIIQQQQQVIVFICQVLYYT